MGKSYLQELEGKKLHDFNASSSTNSKKMGLGGAETGIRRRRCIWVPGALIVGAGPSGLATAACLKSRNVPFLILERSNCIASLWQNKTYDRLRLHLPKNFCQLPFFPFPPNLPTYPTKHDFVSYLESYADHFGLKPVFNCSVLGAEFDKGCGFWRVKAATEDGATVEYGCQWLIVATGENAEEVLPEIEGMELFKGRKVHTSAYKSGELFCGKKVLVVGCGNSGMEVCLDLCNYNARPSLVVRDSVHVLPQEMLGVSTFGLSMWLLKWLPIYLVDRFLLLISWFIFGDTSRFGIHRPSLGPIQLKNLTGKTPVLDVGTLSKIRSGDIKVLPGIKQLTQDGAEFVDGRVEDFDAIIFATGYKSNVPSWLKDGRMFSEEDGCPRKAFPEGWKGEDGLYAVGFTKRGLLGGSIDATQIAQDIELRWKGEAKRSFKASARASPPHSMTSKKGK